MVNVGVPDNLEELKKKVKVRTDWRSRKEAVEELSKWDCKQSRDILKNVLRNDPVYSVVNAAFLGLQRFKENVKLPKKQKGNRIKGIQAKLRKVHDELDPGYTTEEFKNKFSEKFPEEFDTYEGDKQDRLDQWLSNVISNMPKKQST